MKFIVDSMLGKLAKRLRLLGFDTAYDAALSDRAILKTSKDENRIVVTRDKGISKIHGAKVFLIVSTDLQEQLREFYKLAGIRPGGQVPFSRCSECNSPVREVSKEEIKNIVPKRVYETMDKFAYCDKCKKAYWQGSHYEKLKKELS